MHSALKGYIREKIQENVPLGGLREILTNSAIKFK